MHFGKFKKFEQKKMPEILENRLLKLKIIAMALFMVTLPYSQSLILDHNSDFKQFEGKTIACYVGSFDMLHMGHVDIANNIARLKEVDFVLIYSTPGSDKYKKRTSIKLRRQMVKAVFAEDPKVIVTELSPFELQNKFKSIKTKMLAVTGEDKVPSFFSKDKFSQGFRKVFFAGTDLSQGKWQKKQNTATGAATMFRADETILTKRSGAEIKKYNIKVGQKLGRFKLTKIITSDKYDHVSSTKIKKLLAEGRYDEAQKLVHPQVWRIIEQHGLYNFDNHNSKE